MTRLNAVSIMNSSRILYHVTTGENAVAILRDGFKDSAGNYMTNKLWKGVWLTDKPDEMIPVIAHARSCPNPVVLAATVSPSLASVLDGYEWASEIPNCYREWLVPAKLINGHSTVTIAEKWD